MSERRCFASYITPQIIEKNLDFVEEISDYRPELRLKNENIRYSYYKLFFNQAQTVKHYLIFFIQYWTKY